MNPAVECPRYDRCSVNRCPLDAGYHVVPAVAGDRQSKCTMERQVRERIAVKYPDILPWRGLSKRELAGDASQQGLTPGEEAARTARLRKIRPITRRVVRGTVSQDKAAAAMPQPSKSGNVSSNGGETQKHGS